MTTPGSAGRPSVTEQRRKQIVEAFLSLVAERGLEGVGLADVAASAGVQQTNIRHFVGNREDLIVAAIDELSRGFASELQQMSQGDLDIATLLRWFFGPREEYSTQDLAYSLLEPEAIRNPKSIDAVKRIWALTLTILEDGLRRSYPDAATTRIRDTAYVLACMAETNGTLQRLGYPRSRGKAAQKAAWLLAEQLRDGG